MNVAGTIARAISDQGVSVAFGLMGDGNMHVVTELEALGLTVVAARHEAAAMSMASGYAVVSHRVGLCTVTCGPGLTQMVTPLISAVRRRAAVVVFVGEVNSVFDQQYLDQRRLVEACGARYLTIRTPDEGVDKVREAFLLARTERTPVVLGATIDVQRRDNAWTFDDAPAASDGDSWPVIQRVGSDPEVLAQLADAIRRSERPIIVAGEGAIVSGAKDAILELADSIGAAVATTLYAKGLLDCDDFALGIAGAYASRVSEECFAEADLVIGVGASLNRYTTEGGLLFPAATLASINTDPAPPSQYAQPHIAVTGDAKRTVTELIHAMRASEHTQEGFRTDELRIRLKQAAREPLPEFDADGPVEPRAAVRAIEAFVRDDDAIVLGVGHFQDFVIQYLRKPARPAFTFSLSFGSIGEGLATAIGVAFARPDSRVVLFDGDGSLVTTIQELDTVARYGLNIVAFVMNDEGLGAEFHKLAAAGQTSGSAAIRSPDLAGIARGFGVSGATVRNVAELSRVIMQMADDGGPSLVDIRVSHESVSDPFKRLYFGEENAAPHQVL